MSNRDETSRAPFTHMPAVHPGHVLREETLPQLKMSVTAIAQALGVSRQTLHSILAERKAVTVEMALRLGRFLGTSPDLWINLQVNYDKQRLIQKIDLTAIPVCDQLAATKTANQSKSSIHTKTTPPDHPSP